MALWREPHSRSITVEMVVAGAVGYTIMYELAALWAKQFDIGGSTLIWFPPAAVAVGGFYLFGPRLYPVVVIAEIISTAWVTGFGASFGAAGIAVNAMILSVAYLGGGEVLRRLRFDPRLRTLHDVLVLAIGGLLVSSVLASLGGVGVQVRVGLIELADVPTQLALFWVGDVVAIVCLTPLLVLAGHALLEGEPLPLSDKEGVVHPMLILAEYALPSVAAIVLFAAGHQPMQFLYLVFVPMILVAVRHGVPGATIATAVLSATMTVGADRQATGALSASDFQALLGVVAFAALVVGVIVSGRRDILDQHRQLSEIIRATPDLVASASRDGHVVYMNAVGRRLLGLPADAPLTDHQAFEFFPDELAIELMREAMRTADKFGTWDGENSLRTADGRQVPVSQVVIAHEHQSGGFTYSTVCRDVSGQRRLEDQLRRAALYDDATGLANRALLVEQLGRALTTRDRDRSVALLFVDIDRFRMVNESLGFDAGDTVINIIAARLGEAAGPDLISRYGGGLFAVMLTEIAEDFDAIVLADAILEVVARPMEIDGRELVVTASVGIAVASPSQRDPLDLLRASEIAMHRAKEGGGARLALFDEAMERRSMDRLEVESDLRRALSGQEWWLAYQPIIDCATRRIVSCEALLRWTHPVRGPVSPYQLIRLAEQIGLIVPLGREIFHRACVEAKQWHDAGFDLRVAINVSARQLQEPGFADDVQAVLDASGVDPTKIVVEVTETVIAEDLEAEVAVLRKLRELGCGIAIDDFGTGYSSLGGLRDLPIDVLKLDRSFITDLTASPRAAATVEAVINLAEALELLVVAEGVEEEEQLVALCRMGCDRIQGFLVSYPVSPDELTALLVAQRDADTGPDTGVGADDARTSSSSSRPGS